MGAVCLRLGVCPGGTATSFHKLKAHSNVETLVFLAMGLCILVAIKPLYHCVSGGTFAFIIAEGACYLTGALFYTLHKHRYLHTVFHFLSLQGPSAISPR